jgi:hypothetical protein
MNGRFDPRHELVDAKDFRKLAKAFEHSDTMGLCERFSILAVLSEEKAKVLRELEDVSRVQTDAKTTDQLLRWAEIVKSSAKRPMGDN